MTRRRWIPLLLGLLAAGCGGSDLLVGGSVPNPTAVVAPTATPGGCTPSGESCASQSECCLGVCSFNVCQ